jgi:hypothetical protein
LDQIELPDKDDAQISIKMTDIFSDSPFGHYWWDNDECCPEPLLLEIIDIIIGMDDPNTTSTFPWETYESIHGAKRDMGLNKEQQLWYYRRQAWMYVRTLTFVLQRKYLPDSVPDPYTVIDEGKPAEASDE